MSKTKIRYRTELDTSDTREARLQAAQMFVEGDRVRHNITGKLGKFIEVNLGFALPEVWIEFDSETEIHIPLSCNPLLVEVIDKTCTRQRVAGKPVLLENKDLCKSEPQVFLTPGELPIESNEQSTDDTQEERVAVVSVSTGSSNYKLKTEPNEKIIQEVIAIAVIDDTQVVAAEVVEELSEQEEAERHRLELKVERAFVEAGWALQELRDRRLYRNTHKSFEDYCRDRFGMNRSRSYQLIDAATVFDNLSECPQIVDILPTNESQCRPLIQLEPDEQREAWQQAVKAVDGKVPSGRIVKSIVQRLKERGITLPAISFQEGDVVLIRGAGNLDLRKYDGQWAIALRINEYTVAIGLDGKEIVVKPQFLEEVGPEYWTEIKAVNERITRLQLEYNLDAAEDAVLEVLRRRTSFTQKQMTLLAFLEQQYGIC